MHIRILTTNNTAVPPCHIFQFLCLVHRQTDIRKYRAASLQLKTPTSSSWSLINARNGLDRWLDETDGEKREGSHKTWNLLFSRLHPCLSSSYLYLFKNWPKYICKLQKYLQYFAKNISIFYSLIWWSRVCRLRCIFQRPIIFWRPKILPRP